MDNLTAHETNESANHLYKEKVSQLDISLDIQHSKSPTSISMFKHILL